MPIEAKSHDESIEHFRQVGAGTLDAHVWRSRNNPGMLIKTLITEPGEEVDAAKVTDSLSVHVDFEPYYDGLMGSEEAIEKADMMSQAAKDYEEQGVN